METQAPDVIAKSHTTGIGGSLAAAVVGLSRHKTKHDALASILGLKPFETSEAMEIGKVLEPAIRTLYERKTGYAGYVPGDEVEFRHPRYNWALCHPDWLGTTMYSDRMAEFKVAGLHTAKEWQDPDLCQVPQEYYVQCLHNMIVTGKRKCDLVVLLGTELKIYPIKWDQAEAIALFEREQEFWQEHVIEKIPLPIDGSDSCRCLMTWMNPKNVEPLEWATGDTATLLNKFAEVIQNLEAEQGNFDELANKVRDAIGARDGLRTSKIIATWKANKNGVRSLRTKFVDEGEALPA